MASDAANFLIQIEQRVRGDAVTPLSQAEAALKASTDAYKELDVAAQKTAAGVSAASAKLAAAQEKLGKLMAAGDEKGFWKQAGAVDKLRTAEAAAKAEHEKATAALAAGKSAVEGHAARLQKVADASKDTGAAASIAESKVGELKEVMTNFGGPLGNALGGVFRLGDGFKKLASSGGGMGLMVGASVLVVAAVAAVVVAIGAGVLALAKWGIGLANAARDQRLLLEGMSGSAKGGAELQKTFIDIEKATGATGEQLQGYASQLEDAHLSATDMQKALRAIATQEAAIGPGKTAELVAQLKSGQKSAGQLAGEIDRKFGGVVKKRMLGLDQLSERLKVNLGETFGGLKIEGLLTGLSKLVDLFDADTASGKAMKLVFEKIFQPLIDAAASAIPYVELAFLRFINTLLRLYIAAKPAVAKIREFFGITPSQGIEIALKAGEYAAMGLAAAALLVVGIIAAVGAAIALPIAMLFAFQEASTRVGKAVVEAVTGIGPAIEGLDWGAIGLAIVKGIAAGVTGGASLLSDAATKLGQSAANSAKEALGIHSPSRVFAEIGGHSAEGFALGIEDGTDRVGASVSSMLGTPEAAAPRASSSGARSITVEKIEIHASSEDQATSIAAAVTRVFERLALELGTDLTVGEAAP